MISNEDFGKLVQYQADNYGVLIDDPRTTGSLTIIPRELQDELDEEEIIRINREMSQVEGEVSPGRTGGI